MMRPNKTSYVLALLTLLFSVFGNETVNASNLGQTPISKTTTPIQHVIVLMQDGHTFDNYFGTYLGANGIPQGVCMPVDPTNSKASCVKPFHVGNLSIDDLDQSLATFVLQFDRGSMDGFVSSLNKKNKDGALTMGYYDEGDLPYYWNLADEFVLFDHFFSSTYESDFSNYMYWVAAVPGGGRLLSTGYGENVPTIFDNLEARAISCKFTLNNHNPFLHYRSNFIDGKIPAQVTHLPLSSFDRFIDDPALSSHIVDLDQYYSDLRNNTLPAVAYVLPMGVREDQTIGIQSGQRLTKTMVQALMQSEAWNSSAFVLTYSGWGGWYDHVPPPRIDEFGYGFRVPTILISPYARQNYIDSSQLDSTSILKFIEDNWNLKPLADRDAKANSIKSGFDFTQPPRSPHFISFARESNIRSSEPRRQVIYIFYGTALVFAIVMLVIIAFNTRLTGKSFVSSHQRNDS